MIHKTDIENPKRFYVYQYINPTNDKPLYVGSGTKNRYKQHLSDKPEYCPNKRFNGKIRLLRESGQEPIIEIVKDNLTEKKARKLESELIQKYGRIGYEENGVLLNHLIDANPPNYSGKEHPMYGKHHTEETKKKMSKSMQGRKPWITGKNHSETTKQKISKSNFGKKRSDEVRKKISERQLGRKQPESQKKKVSKANSKTWQITKPNGETITITNLLKYCKDNNLDQGNMTKVANGTAKQHKRYTCKRL